MLRITSILLATAVLALGSPNFSGHWKLNADKSKLDDPYQEERTIEHKDPDMTVNIKSVSDGEESESAAKYRTDGKETRTMIDGDPQFSTAHWDGDALVVDSQIVSDTDTYEFHDRWTLSTDGKVLTITRKQKVGRDERDLLFVYDLL